MEILKLKFSIEREDKRSWLEIEEKLIVLEGPEGFEVRREQATNDVRSEVIGRGETRQEAALDWLLSNFESTNKARKYFV